MAKSVNKRPSSSVFKGVNFNKRSGKWASSVSADGERHECGLHDTERLAAIARDTFISKKGLKVPLQVLVKVVANQK